MNYCIKVLILFVDFTSWEYIIWLICDLTYFPLHIKVWEIYEKISSEK